MWSTRYNEMEKKSAHVTEEVFIDQQVFHRMADEKDEINFHMDEMPTDLIGFNKLLFSRIIM